MASERDVAVEVADPPVENQTDTAAPASSLTNDAIEAPSTTTNAVAEASAAAPSAAPVPASATTTAEPDKHGCALFATLFFFLLSFSGAFVVGGVLISVGVKQANAACDFSFATFALVYGSLVIVYGGLSLIAAGVIASNHESSFGKSLDRFNRSLLAPCIGGVFIWGTVLAFSNNRWNDVMVSTPAGGAPCDAALYRPVAIIIIVIWSVAAAACFFGCLFACCFACCFGGIDGLRRLQTQAHSPGQALRQVSSRNLRV